MRIEAVYRGRRRTPVAMYIVMDGERVAYRGRHGGVPAWISMKGGGIFSIAIDAPGSETLQ
jgi:hypothetical protein